MAIAPQSVAGNILFLSCLLLTILGAKHRTQSAHPAALPSRLPGLPGRSSTRAGARGLPAAPHRSPGARDGGAQVPERFPALPSRCARPAAGTTFPPRAGTLWAAPRDRSPHSPPGPARPFPTHQQRGRSCSRGRAGPPAARPEQSSADGGTAPHAPSPLGGHVMFKSTYH